MNSQNQEKSDKPPKVLPNTPKISQKNLTENSLTMDAHSQTPSQSPKNAINGIPLLIEPDLSLKYRKSSLIQRDMPRGNTFKRVAFTNVMYTENQQTTNKNDEDIQLMPVEEDVQFISQQDDNLTMPKKQSAQSGMGLTDIISDSTVQNIEYSDSDDHEDSFEETFFPHHSSMAKVKRDERQDAEKIESQLDQEKKELDRGETTFVQKLIKYDTDEFMLKRPFERAQFHQCIPNPILDGEYITVQFVKIQLSEADVSENDPEEFQNQKLKEYEEDSSMMYQKYQLDANQEEYLKKVGSSVTRSFSEKSKKEIQKEQIIKQNFERMVSKQDHAQVVTLNECKNQMKKKDKPMDLELQKILKPGSSVAIIGYWRKIRNEYAREQSEFKCYHYFYVPNPERKQISKETKTTQTLYKFLFQTHKHQNQENDKVFFFYKDVDGISGLKIAILNCKPKLETKKWQEQEKGHILANNIKAQYKISHYNDISVFFSKKSNKVQFQDPILLEDFEDINNIRLTPRTAIKSKKKNAPVVTKLGTTNEQEIVELINIK